MFTYVKKNWSILVLLVAYFFVLSLGANVLSVNAWGFDFVTASYQFAAFMFGAGVMTLLVHLPAWVKVKQ